MKERKDIVKKFFRFLKEKNAYSKYIKFYNKPESVEWRDENDVGQNISLPTFLDSSHPRDFIANAFWWERTESFEKWDKIHNEWCIELKKYEKTKK